MLTTRGVLCLLLLAVILGATSHLWNPTARGLHDTLKSPSMGQQGGSTGDPFGPE